jgi:hypothetical protein
MRLIAFIFLFTTSVAFASAENEHFPILGDKAKTVKKGDWQFGHMPGGNATSTIFFNSFTYGLTDRFEIGAAPYIFSMGEMIKYTFSTKYTLLQSRNWQFAIGYSQIKLGINSKQENGESRYQTWWNYFSYSFNYTPQTQDYNIGLTIKQTQIEEDMQAKMNYDGLPYYYSFSDSYIDHSWNLEANYRYNHKWWLGFSIGTAREEMMMTTAEEEREPLQRTYGVAANYRKDIWIFKEPSFALVHFEQGGVTSLFSARF